MILESEETVTKRENWTKKKAKLEVLNQQNSENHCHSRGASQVKFKNLFILEMKKLLGIIGSDSCFFFLK